MNADDEQQTRQKQLMGQTSATNTITDGHKHKRRRERVVIIIHSANLLCLSAA